MKRMLAGLVVVLSAQGAAPDARGADSPVIVIHEVTGYEKQNDTALISYTLHVLNPGDKALANLTLAVVPPKGSRAKRSILKVGSLEPGRRADLTVKVARTPAPRKDLIRHETLLLAGKASDGAGNAIEFPAMSHIGGGR